MSCMGRTWSLMGSSSHKWVILRQPCLPSLSASSSWQQSPPPPRKLQVRFMSDEPPLNSIEERDEKYRVASLSPHQKKLELRRLDAELAKLQMLRGINTGELYTLRGKFKAMTTNYGVPFVMWYWAVWITTGVCTYGAIHAGAIDAVFILERFDNFTGFNLSDKVDVVTGEIGLAVAINELLEVVRLPFVMFTIKPIVRFARQYDS